MFSFISNILVPTPVRNLEVYPMNNRDAEERGVVIVRWKRPKFYNGILNGYTIETCAISDDGILANRGICPQRFFSLYIYIR